MGLGAREDAGGGIGVEVGVRVGISGGGASCWGRGDQASGVVRGGGRCWVVQLGGALCSCKEALTPFGVRRTMVGVGWAGVGWLGGCGRIAEVEYRADENARKTDQRGPRCSRQVGPLSSQLQLPLGYLVAPLRVLACHWHSLCCQDRRGQRTLLLRMQREIVLPPLVVAVVVFVLL